MKPPKRSIAAVTLLVDDYDTAIAWYTEKLGFKLTEDVQLGDDRRWVTVTAGNDGCCLLLARAEGAAQKASIGAQTGGRVGFFLHSNDFGRDYAAMTARGVHFLEMPRHESYGTVAVFVDLYGNKWDLIEPDD